MSHRVVAVFGSSASRPGDGHYEDGVRCGRLLAESGFAVVTGGYGGLMEAVSEGAATAGGRVLGVTAPRDFPERTGANRWVAEEVRAASITERLHEMTRVSAASIALHGSLGTFTELVVAWNLAFVAAIGGRAPKPVIAVGRRWEEIVASLTGSIETTAGLVTCVPTVDAAVSEVLRRL